MELRIGNDSTLCLFIFARNGRFTLSIAIPRLRRPIKILLYYGVKKVEGLRRVERIQIGYEVNEKEL